MIAKQETLHDGCFTIKYNLKAVASGAVDKKTLKACDDGAKATAKLLRRVAKVSSGWIMWAIVGVLASYRKRIITKNAIEYHFKLIK